MSEHTKHDSGSLPVNQEERASQTGSPPVSEQSDLPLGGIAHEVLNPPEERDVVSLGPDKPRVSSQVQITNPEIIEKLKKKRAGKKAAAAGAMKSDPDSADTAVFHTVATARRAPARQAVVGRRQPAKHQDEQTPPMEEAAPPPQAPSPQEAVPSSAGPLSAQAPGTPPLPETYTPAAQHAFATDPDVATSMPFPLGVDPAPEQASVPPPPPISSPQVNGHAGMPWPGESIAAPVYSQTPSHDSGGAGNVHAQRFDAPQYVPQPVAVPESAQYGVAASDGTYHDSGPEQAQAPTYATAHQEYPHQEQPYPEQSYQDAAFSAPSPRQEDPYQSQIASGNVLHQASGPPQYEASSVGEARVQEYPQTLNPGMEVGAFTQGHAAPGITAPDPQEVTQGQAYDRPTDQSDATPRSGEQDTAHAAESGPEQAAGPPGENGRPRVRIPWDETAVQELEYGEVPSRDHSGQPEENGAETVHAGRMAAGRALPGDRRTTLNNDGLKDGSERNEGYMATINGGRMPPGSGGEGGAWLWLPNGIEPRASWRKRHPLLFWGAVLLLMAVVFNAGRLSMQDLSFGRAKLAVITLEGIILDSGKIVQWIERVANDDSYKGALLRVNSPGGAVGPSQEIYAALKRLDGKKPVVASLGTLAASGGYYAALGAREIIAGPSTITGSIGIKMQVPNVEGLMKTLGVSERTLVSGAFKDAGSAWRPMAPEEEEYFYGIMDDMYEEFVGVVSHERKISMADMGNIADGKAMTGRQALLLKLVDGLGDRQEALSRLKALCGLDEKTPVKLVEGPRRKAGVIKEMLSSLVGLLQERQSVTVQPMFIY